LLSDASHDPEKLQAALNGAGPVNLDDPLAALDHRKAGIPSQEVGIGELTTGGGGKVNLGRKVNPTTPAEWASAVPINSIPKKTKNLRHQRNLLDILNSPEEKAREKAQAKADAADDKKIEAALNSAGPVNRDDPLAALDHRKAGITPQEVGIGEVTTKGGGNFGLGKKAETVIDPDIREQASLEPANNSNAQDETK